MKIIIGGCDVKTSLIGEYMGEIRRIHNKWFVMISLGAFIISTLFYISGLLIDNKVKGMYKEQEALLLWGTKHEKGKIPLWGKTNDISTASAFKEAGMIILEREELEEEIRSTGIIYKEKILLKGSYIQLLTSFDIMKDKYKGASFIILHIARKQSALLITGEIRTFRSRGIYEEEKYSSYRTDGNG